MHECPATARARVSTATLFDAKGFLEVPIPAESGRTGRVCFGGVGAEFEVEVARIKLQAVLADHETNLFRKQVAGFGEDAVNDQARRVEEIRQALKNCRAMPLAPYDAASGIQIGALIQLEADNGSAQWLFLAPDAAGLKLEHVGQTITVITPRSPLGAALLGKQLDDEVQINVGGAVQVFSVCETL